MTQWDMNQALGLKHDQNSFFSADWPAPAGVRTLITTRIGGYSRSPFTSLNVGMHVGDDPQSVQRNRDLVQQQVTKPLAYLQQIHGTEVINALEAVRALEAGEPWQADASFCRLGGDVACAIMTAEDRKSVV